MNDFVAVDVETANGAPTSICSIGAVKVLDGEIVDSFYELVKPEPNFTFVILRKTSMASTAR